LGDVVETAAANPLVGNLSKPTLDQIQPRTRRRNEVEVESGMSITMNSEIKVHYGSNHTRRTTFLFPQSFFETYVPRWVSL
jgi:hypothetical protein